MGRKRRGERQYFQIHTARITERFDFSVRFGVPEFFKVFGI